jgi:GxxExxY protein
MDRENALAKIALDCAFRVHTVLGPGLLESAYKACLAIELRKAGLSVAIEYPVPLHYEGEIVADIGYRMDLLVEALLVIEVKAVEALHPVHAAQVLSYLKLSERKLGLLINFNVVHLRDGIKRIIHGY